MATTKYHLTARGEPAACHAHERPCPRGGAEDHFPTREEAQETFEKRQGAGVPAAVRRTATPRSVPDFSSFAAVEERFSKTTLLDPKPRYQGYEHGVPAVDSKLIAAHSKQEWEQVSETLRAKAEETVLELREVPSISSTTAAPLVEAYKRIDEEIKNDGEIRWDRVEAAKAEAKMNDSNNPNAGSDAWTQAYEVEKLRLKEAEARRARAKEALLNDPAYKVFEKRVQPIYARSIKYSDASAVARAAARVADSRVVDGVRVPAGHILTPTAYDLQGNLMGPATSSATRSMTNSAGEQLKVRYAGHKTRSQRVEEDLKKGYYVGTGMAPITLSMDLNGEGLRLPTDYEVPPSPVIDGAWEAAEKDTWSGLDPDEFLPKKNSWMRRGMTFSRGIYAKVDARSVKAARKVMKPTGDNKP